ncbi:MAG TPA: argininosuccinate lyase [Syntrophomonadaceae bacterium]|nr:argininosuccinate lyase [Syntrophomonadaceae bacterium]
MKLWGGRFTKETAEDAAGFLGSLSFDARLYRQDIRGSIAHARMLGRQGIITPEEAEALVRGLEEIRAELEAGKLAFNPDAEDIHSFIEECLVAKVGEVGKKLHTARSRNDQVATSFRLYVKEEIEALGDLVLRLIEALIGRARETSEVIMPGYTHLQRAQPVTFAHHLLAYCEMLRRDYERLRDCYKRVDVCPLGSGALAGTTFPIDRQFVARELGFGEISANSLDAVSDRDFVAELLFACSLIMMHLSRLAEELILWSSSEFGFITLDDAYTTGSSIMPQKKNPDVAELARGKTGRVYGHLMGILTVMKGLPLAYNKDLQEDKEAVFDALDTVKGCVGVFIPMMETLQINEERMREAAGGDFTNATDLADYLVRKGVSFRDAHGIVGRVVLYCIGTKKRLEDLTMEEYRSFSQAFDWDLYDFIQIATCVGRRRAPGGPAPFAVFQNIGRITSWLAEMRQLPWKRGL